jgi:hypothetical protein
LPNFSTSGAGTAYLSGAPNFTSIKKRDKITSSGLTKHYRPILDTLQLNLKYTMQEEEFEDTKGVV